MLAHTYGHTCIIQPITCSDSLFILQLHSHERATPLPAHGYPVNQMSGRTMVRNIGVARQFIGQNTETRWDINHKSCQFLGYFPTHSVLVDYTISSSRINPESSIGYLVGSFCGILTTRVF